MLQHIRDRAQNFVAYIIVGFIALALVVTGMTTYFADQVNNVNVAEVNDVPIPQAYFQDTYQRQRALLRQQLGEAFNPRFFDEDLMKRQVLDQLIEEALLIKAAQDAGHRVSDVQVGTEIRAFSAFQDNGQFSSVRYEQALQNQGMSIEFFEDQVRRSILTQSYRSGIMGTAFEPQHAIESIFKRQSQKRKLAYALFEHADYYDRFEVDDDQIQAYYDKHINDFQSPEAIKIEYVTLSRDAIAERISVDDETVSRLYEERSAEFVTEEERRASHILFTIDDNAAEDAKKKAEDILKRIQEDESRFAELATTHSDDPGSASEGGDLGYFSHSMMDAAFADTAFDLELNQVSEVVRSSFGYHIIKLTDIRPATAKPLEDVRDRLISDFRNRQAEDQYFDHYENLTTLAFENPDSLDVVAEELGLTINLSEWFTRDQGEGVANDLQVREVAFSDDVFTSNYNSEPLELVNGESTVLRVRERRPAAPKPLEEVKDEIIELIKIEKGSEIAKGEGEEMKKRIAAGENVQEIAEALQVEWLEPGEVERNDIAVEREVLDFLFKMKKPALADQAEIQVSKLSTGDYAVIALYEVMAGDASELDDAQKAQLTRSRSQEIGFADFQAYVDMLKTKAEVVEYPENI